MDRIEVVGGLTGEHRAGCGAVRRRQVMRDLRFADIDGVRRRIRLGQQLEAGVVGDRSHPHALVRRRHVAEGHLFAAALDDDPDGALVVERLAHGLVETVLDHGGTLGGGRHVVCRPVLIDDDEAQWLIVDLNHEGLRVGAAVVEGQGGMAVERDAG